MDHDFPSPEEEKIIYNPSFERMRSLSRHLETTTEYGSPSYVTDVRSRIADKTKNNVDHSFDDLEELREVRESLEDREMVCLDREVGDGDHSYTCRYYVPKEQARIALAWSQLLEPASGEPDFVTVQLPDWRRDMVRVFPGDGVTYVLGSDYSGEAKKSFLRLFMYREKERGGIGLHAGSKRVTVETGEGMDTVGQLFLGLSGTGKTTLTSHGMWLEGQEEAEMVQDDVLSLHPEGSAIGSEGKGLFIKTYGLEEEEQPELYHAATQPKSVLENVRVEEDGTVDFFDDGLTRNGRSVVQRSDLHSASEEITLERVDQIFFITRNSLLPPVARLSSEQGAAAFMLGESVKTSAASEEEAGEAVRVVGTNPFIIGSRGEEGNRFLELVESVDATCYLLNTGDVGGEEIGVEETVKILRAIVSEEIDWEELEEGLEFPKEVPGVDISRFRPEENVGGYKEKVEELREERRSYLKGFEDLEERIIEAVY
ncbi:MAG: phosphoenolpyruvate carboxykinase (ATP) [Candidatus Nanohaloarchaeota archaeon QJJ-7]|nr:phosphoenolpyruvate carboxykinase (ATP) [Candidatus Nanohaloarchaeota archaeon QJJ-7]